MKKMISIISSVNALICAGGISFLSTMDSFKKHELTPQVRQIRQMNPNVPNIIVGDFRLQILDDYTVRFEYKYNNPVYKTYGWLDDDTLFVPNRTLYPGPTQYSDKKVGSEEVVSFGDITIKIPTDIGSDMKGIKVYQKGITEPIYNSDSQIDDNTGDLPKPEETGNVYEFVDYPRIIEPILGYSESNAQIEPYRSHWKELGPNCGFEIQEHKDIYLTFPHKDPKALRQQYRNLAGAPELTRLSTLGAWDSRYYPYNEQTAQEEVDHYYENDLPLDNLVIDTDWRAGFDGKGYFVNETLFPNMPRFLQSMHNQNIEVCFNDHPEPHKDLFGNELPVLDPNEVAFRRHNLDKIIGMGLDTWWYDRNWSTSLICPGGKTDEHEKMLNHETWGDYLYNNVTTQAHIRNAIEKYSTYGAYAYTRPTTMSNVVQIRNGVWDGFTDSAAHRYSIQWTGDQHPSMLPTEIENVVRTGNNSMPYMSSDLAGHNEAVASDYYYQRWMEYGALSPIFRIHCTRDLEQHCQPWYRPENVINTFRNWIKLRYRLLPLYYSLAKEAYDTGMPICRALGFHYDNVPEQYREKEYLIGSNILFAPCTQPDVDTIDGDSWVTWNSEKPEKPLTVKLYRNTELEGNPAATVNASFSDLADMKKFGEGWMDQGNNFSAKITGTFIPTENRCVWLKSDDGCKFTITNEAGTEIASASDWRSHSATYVKSDVELEAGTKYNIDISYFNGTEGGSLAFAGTKKQELTEETKKVYLPKGEWFDVFTGQVFTSTNGTEVEVTCPDNENALFVKLGSMLPLINNAHNTKELDWTNLVYDVYPSITAERFASSLYEDDFTTVAYQNGYYHNSPYECYYDNQTHEYVINLSPSSGWYIGDDVIANRTYKLRVHKVNGIDLQSVTVDGINVSYETIAADPSIAMPFNFDGASRTDEVIEITIPSSSIRVGHSIRIKVGA